MTASIWAAYPTIQQRYQEILDQQRQLQHTLGIEPKSLAQRIDILNEKRRQQELHRLEQQRREKELAKFKLSTKKPSLLPVRRPV